MNSDVFTNSSELFFIRLLGSVLGTESDKLIWSSLCFWYVGTSSDHHCFMETSNTMLEFKVIVFMVVVFFLTDSSCKMQHHWLALFGISSKPRNKRVLWMRA